MPYGSFFLFWKASSTHQITFLGPSADPASDVPWARMAGFFTVGTPALITLIGAITGRAVAAFSFLILVPEFASLGRRG